jgi:hypothetical protein
MACSKVNFTFTFTAVQQREVPLVPIEHEAGPFGAESNLLSLPGIGARGGAFG